MCKVWLNRHLVQVVKGVELNLMPATAIEKLFNDPDQYSGRDFYVPEEHATMYFDSN